MLFHAMSPRIQSCRIGRRVSTIDHRLYNRIRFYKDLTSTGSHTGSLWSSTGKLLATATFTNETASGWQEVTFSQPVKVTAGYRYVASYHTNGHYVEDIDYFSASGVSNGNLVALSTSIAGGNGVFRFGPSAFPNQSYAGTNYWVDVVFLDKANSQPPTADAGADLWEMRDPLFSLMAPQPESDR